MGIVTQTTVISANTIAPSGYLHAGIPLVQVFFFGSSPQIACLLYPTAYTEFTTCTQQFILQQQYIQEFPGVTGKTAFIKAFEVSNGPVINNTSFIGKRLSYNVYQVIFKVIITTIFIGYFHHQPCCFFRNGRIIIVLHLRPARCLEVIQRRTSAENRLMRALLVISKRTVINGIGKQSPCFFYLLVSYTITGKEIIFQPFFFREFLRSPGKFAHQFKHHGVILCTFHGQTYSFQVNS